MLFTLEVYSKTNMVNLNNKNPSNAWPGRVLSTVHSVPEMNSKQKEILKKDFTGYNGRNISKIMLH